MLSNGSGALTPDKTWRLTALSRDSTLSPMADVSRRRTKLGEKASAALPLLWAEMERRGWTDADLARELNEYTGKIAKLVYGDRKPGRVLSGKLLTRLGIPFDSWEQRCPVRRRPHDGAPPSIHPSPLAKTG